MVLFEALDPAIRVSFSDVVPLPDIVLLTRNGLGWFMTLSAGKFCHANLVWLAGQVLI